MMSLRLVCTCLVLTLVSLPAPALAQTAEERAAAHTEFERGVAAYTAHDYTTALDAFQEAYRLAPHASVRLNIANCYDQLSRPIEALFHFEHYLTEATGLTPAQRRDVQASIARLEARVGTITLAITPDGASITIDGSITRRAPVSEPVRVTAGDHTVDITLDGYVAEHQTVHVDGGASARVSTRLRRAEAVASTGGSGTPTETSTTTTTTTTETSATTEPTVTTAETTTTVSTETTTSETGVAVDEGPSSADESTDSGGGIRVTLPVWIAGGFTAAALIGWAIVGPLALVENAAFDTDVRDSNDMRLTEEQRADARSSGLGHADTARAMALASDVLLVTTIVGAGVTTFFFILAQTESDDTEPAAIVMVTPVLAPDYAGAMALGSF